MNSSTLDAAGNGRIDWIDIAKGIGIVLVVVGHTALEDSGLGRFIYSFHMPLFFFLSGYLFSVHKYTGFAAFIKKKATTLLIPYFLFASVSYIYFLLRYHFGDANYYKDLDLLQVFTGIFYSAGTREWMDFNLPLWFLTCLFVVECMYYMFSRMVQTNSGMMLILVICSAVGYLDSLLNSLKLPWGIDVAFTAVVFYGMGNLLKPAYRSLLSRPAVQQAAAACICLCVNLFLLRHQVNLNMKRYGDYFDFYLAAAAGITFCLLIASLIRTLPPLAYLGRQSLIIMSFHMPLLNISTKVLNHVGVIPNPYAFEGMRAVITLLLLVPVIYGLNKFAPFALGKRKKTVQADRSQWMDRTNRHPV
ncbi:acyltransferase family protein [Paenibacillus piri]|nr:acyltransferase family protein [Paenibacillus piri]